jgi:CheY-like chemotaxis protein
VSEKRALIVDDSKSARVVLSRLLEKYELAVDTRDNAEQALEYLKARRPDVIFMDHLMPGMDGLEAVQAIRRNPDTAAIPIMMYTSQEGEVYLGQARAFGATGVLPKRIGSTEVSQMLQDLQLLTPAGGPASETVAANASSASGPIIVTAPGSASEPASTAPAAAVPAVADPVVVPAPRPSAEEIGAALEPLLKQHSGELRRFVVASLESFAARVVTDTRELVRSTLPPAPVAAPVAAAPLPEPVAPPPAPRPGGWIAATLVAVVAAVLAAGFAWRAEQRLDEVLARLPASPSAASVPTPASAAEADAPAVARESGRAAGRETRAAVPPAAESLDVLPVPYGESPLTGPRLERLATLLGELERRGARGVVTISWHSGDYCLTGNPAEGYLLAPDAMPADRCDLVGNPHADALRPAQREPEAYDALVAATRARSNGALDVRVVEAGRNAGATPYPDAGSATAAQWNTAAAANQRLEIALRAAPPGTRG